MKETTCRTFRKTLLMWYRLHKRDLPWRRTTDPYRIWISEIMLQQTRVGQGIGYYERFLERFPDIVLLARASEREVLKSWQGLGYYTRARNLHAAARTVVKRHGGKFPGSYEEILALEGIGEYTAAAIASIAFGQPRPVVDGNVLRFLSRYSGLRIPVNTARGKEKIKELASGLIGKKDPGEFNQAVMEFGALQCKQVKPDCTACPLKKGCRAFRSGTTGILPVREKRKSLRRRYFHYLVIGRKNRGKEETVSIRKRDSRDIWKNLYDFPLIETSRPVSRDKLVQSPEWERIAGKEAMEITGISKTVRYVLSHQVIHARFIMIRSAGKRELPFLQVPVTRIREYPVPGLIEKFLKSDLFTTFVPAAFSRKRT
jgi:A/G-specific adenine glycosylase